MSRLAAVRIAEGVCVLFEKITIGMVAYGWLHMGMGAVQYVLGFPIQMVAAAVARARVWEGARARDERCIAEERREGEGEAKREGSEGEVEGD